MISLSGLDMPWLKDKAYINMPKAKRKREKSKRSNLPFPYVMSDIKPFVSPVGDWGSGTGKQPEVISSRKKLRDHVRAYGLIEAGDVKPGTIARKNEAKKKALEDLAKGVSGEWA